MESTPERDVENWLHMLDESSQPAVTDPSYVFEANLSPRTLNAIYTGLPLSYDGGPQNSLFYQPETTTTYDGMGVSDPSLTLCPAYFPSQQAQATTPQGLISPEAKALEGLKAELCKVKEDLSSTRKLVDELYAYLKKLEPWMAEVSQALSRRGDGEPMSATTVPESEGEQALGSAVISEFPRNPAK